MPSGCRLGFTQACSRGNVFIGTATAIEWRLLEMIRYARQFLLAAPLLGSLLVSTSGLAAEAELVMDAESGEILFEKNAKTARAPAGLAKLMTLYLAFEAVTEGHLSMDDQVHISANAATEPPVVLGLTEVDTLKLRYLVRATAVGGANDAATALAEAVAGSEPEFVDMMNTKAEALGMTGSHFTNAHGLTEEGITTTALDIAVLFRALNEDFPQYMNILARRSNNAGVGSVSHSGTRFLEISRNIYAAKTGYTREAKFTAVVMVDNDIRQLIVVGLGGDSTGSLQQDVGKLIDEWLER